MVIQITPKKLSATAPGQISFNIIRVSCYAIIFLLFLFLITSHSATSKSPTINFSAKIVPNTSTMTEYYFSQHILVNNMTLKNGTLFINDYSINSTSASSNSISLYNWFDAYGVSFTSSKTDIIHLNVSDKGEPSRVNGASYTYDGGTKILNLTVSANKKVGIHWGSGGSAYLSNYDIKGFAHSWGIYKTCYGYGIIVGDLKETYAEQRLFSVKVYANTSKNDIQSVKLKIGENISLTCEPNKMPVTRKAFKEESDSNDFFILRTSICSAKYDSSNKYWNIIFGGVFKTYFPRMQLQNLTVTVTSSEGTTSNVNYGAWFVYEPVNPPVSPIPIPFYLMMPIMGCIGFVMVIFSPYYCIRQFQKKNYGHGFVWAFVLTLIGIGLIIAWLWG